MGTTVPLSRTQFDGSKESQKLVAFRLALDCSYRLGIYVVRDGGLQRSAGEKLLVDCMKGHGRVSGPGVSIIRVDNTGRSFKHCQTLKVSKQTLNGTNQ